MKKKKFIIAILCLAVAALICIIGNMKICTIEEQVFLEKYSKSNTAGKESYYSDKSYYDAVLTVSVEQSEGISELEICLDGENPLFKETFEGKVDKEYTVNAGDICKKEICCLRKYTEAKGSIKVTLKAKQTVFQGIERFLYRIL